MNFGEVLKLVRTKKGLTQKDMAALSGISQNYLSLIESNKKTPSLETIKDFAKSLNVSKDALMFISSDVPPELGDDGKKDFQKLQQNILSLILFEVDGELQENA